MKKIATSEDLQGNHSHSGRMVQRTPSGGFCSCYDIRLDPCLKPLTKRPRQRLRLHGNLQADTYPSATLLDDSTTLRFLSFPALGKGRRSLSLVKAGGRAKFKLLVL